MAKRSDHLKQFVLGALARQIGNESNNSWHDPRS
jgi:hypothetical protein